MWQYFWTKRIWEKNHKKIILICCCLSSTHNFWCIFFIPVSLTTQPQIYYKSNLFTSKYTFFSYRRVFSGILKFETNFSDKNRSFLTNCWGVVCQAQLDLPALLSSGYLPFEIPPGMKINWGQARMRPRAGVPSAALCALFWVHSAYPWQVMPAADKRSPLPVLCLDWEPGVSIPLDSVTFI